jgi:hypothetical protein
MRHGAAVGLKLYVKAFPLGRRLLDDVQLGMINGFNIRIHRSWERTLEAVVPIPGDLRAADELIRNEVCSCAIEAIARLADVQAQVRAAQAKRRDLGADRLILLVKATHANRRAIRDAGSMLLEAFPVHTRAAMRALSEGRDPGGDALILI